LRWNTKSDTQRDISYRLNGVTSSDYYGVRAIAMNDNTRSTVTNNPNSSFSGGKLSGNRPTSTIMYIPNYLDTTQLRTELSYFGGLDPAQINGTGYQAGQLNSTAAVSSVTIFLNAGYMRDDIGASIDLYGIS
jgi:hypothetical protein